MSVKTKPLATVSMCMSESAPGRAGSSNTDSGKTLCPECGKECKGNQGLAQHSIAVHGENLARVTITCDYCGDEMKVPPSDLDLKDGHYCSTECHNLWMAENQVGEGHHQYNSKTIECDWCGNEFERQPSHIHEHNFCSYECANKWKSETTSGEQSWHWKGGEQELECEMCGNTYSVPLARVEDARFCSESCHGKWVSQTFQGEDHPNWKGGHVDYYGPNWNRQRKKARERDNNTCQMCGRGEDELGKLPDTHHIRPVRWFKQRYDEPEWYERAHSLENLIVLCQSCHNRWEGIPLKPQVD